MNLPKTIKTSHGFFILLTIVIIAGVFCLWQAKNLKFETPEIVALSQRIKKPMSVDIAKRPKPNPISIERMKSQGCVSDGLLSEYNPDSANFAALINRSNCYYLHRAIETWLTPPDFETVDYEISQIEKKDVAYGMFIAEAISVRKDYFNDKTGKKFDFKKMCREGSENVWGEGSCKPTFASQEYRDYVQYISEKAIDLGVQSITFGQIYMQESGKRDYAPKIVEKIRKYANKNGRDVVIGAQTGAITDEKYLQLFDYIEGGVGINSEGWTENGPCLSTRGSCWALLWHDNFASKAKNVLLHLDWSGIPSDDLDIFARMTPEKRAQTLAGLYRKFDNGKTGFLMPFFGVLDNENGGCRGPKKKFYSPDNAYSCKDENIINAILAGKNNSTTLSENTAIKNGG